MRAQLENKMKITNYTNAGEMPAESQFDYIIEVSAWADCGTSENMGITGHPTNDELWDLLASEVSRVREWIDSEAESGAMDARTDEPQIAIVRQRPEADEDGDFPPSHEWPIIIDWN